MKYLLSTLLLITCLSANAQLKAPIQEDTLKVISMEYNYTEVKKENWPFEYIYKGMDYFRFGKDNTIKIKEADRSILSKESYYYKMQDYETLYYDVNDDKTITITYSGYVIQCVQFSKVNNNQSVKKEEKIDSNLGSNENSDKEEIPYLYVEKKPSFRGGDANAFSKWVGRHLRYPEIAKECGIQGCVMVSFTIKTNGKVDNVKVIRGVDPALDREAIRVVKSSPKWRPGEQRGRAINVTYTIPVIFRLW